MGWVRWGGGGTSAHLATSRTAIESVPEGGVEKARLEGTGDGRTLGNLPSLLSMAACDEAPAPQQRD